MRLYILGRYKEKENCWQRKGEIVDLEFHRSNHRRIRHKKRDCFGIQSLFLRKD
ncbi:hypothetical protein FUSO4_04155 [Fusobacterium necrophorum DJ-1]|uniref:Uncharacterized protein n=2 Tax=Fusobacterium necrophorum TaxID=859 RepID=A0AB73BXF3_9FUSO|nr:hypothetical protein FUSO3_05895 [Fusobacterium necrophorum BL]KDE66045.1 hypothetical protein FUSO5_03380 [Fusobacterium necrophorum BFTR-1]KDE66753.1 hypothetical protein FUSO4_04155 [Fusobacterium necrophorum DJ-1]KDE72114.1 hypothetical protein FUSO8_06535 [Fusobacterium necrophorum DJ-2]KDE72945.1 hypothetical protein FUSO7_07470 [Fusobacterium necrophorum BFTR-2]